MTTGNPKEPDFLQLIRHYQITITSLPVAYWQEWAKSLRQEDGDIPPSLRVVIVGMEQVQKEPLKIWRDKVGNRIEWYNFYGPAEATCVSTYYQADFSVTPLFERMPIGRPIDNVSVYILDQYLQPVPVGVKGELYIGGIGVSCGYLNQPKLTEERFITHPFGLGRLYRTGDFARYLPDGNIEFLERKDHQVKIRGFRIELGEIENILSQHPKIKDQVVIASQGTTGKELVAYYVPYDDISNQELRYFLQNKLPDYMIPSVLIPLSKLPLTTSGKLDRQALPSTPKANTELKLSDFPRDLLEHLLVNIWRSILGKQSIGIHDNFFELGGHSLLALTLFEQINKSTEQQLPLTILFQAPTIAQQAEILREHNVDKHWSALVMIQPKGSKPPLFLVPPAGGTGLRFRRLAHYLGEEQPLYSFQPVGSDGKAQPHTTIEEMASYYIHEMQLFQPEGPYRIGGSCFGGHVAWEMARQLENQNCLVEAILLLDPAEPANGPDWHWLPPPRKTPTYLMQRIAYHWVNGTLWESMIRRRLFNLKKLYSRSHHDFTQLLSAHRQAQFNYQAPRLPTRTLLLQSEQYKTPMILERWKRIAFGDFDSYMIPDSTHLSLLAENDMHTQQMVQLIQDYIAKLDNEKMSNPANTKEVM